VLYLRKAKITKLRPILNMSVQKAHLLQIWCPFPDALSIPDEPKKYIPKKIGIKKLPEISGSGI